MLILKCDYLALLWIKGSKRKEEFLSVDYIKEYPLLNVETKKCIREVYFSNIIFNQFNIMVSYEDMIGLCHSVAIL